MDALENYFSQFYGLDNNEEKDLDIDDGLRQLQRQQEDEEKDGDDDEVDRIDTIYLFFDLFVINQHKKTWTYEWLSTTFQSMIQQIGLTVVVLYPWYDPIPLKRAWCVYEAYCALVSSSEEESEPSSSNGSTTQTTAIAKRHPGGGSSSSSLRMQQQDQVVGVGGGGLLYDVAVSYDQTQVSERR